jgi:signal transduction histidine kinase
VPKGVPTEFYHHVFRLTDQDDLPVANEASPPARAARGEKVSGQEIVWHTPAGRFSLLVASEMLPKMHGHPATALLTLQDVSKLKDFEVRLQQAVRVRDDFLAIAAHELRTPLTTLQLRLAKVLRKLVKDGEVPIQKRWIEQELETSARQVRKLTTLVNALVDVARFTAGKLPLKLEQVDLSELLNEVGERFARSAVEAGCELSVHTDAQVVGRWDRERLEQILVSLLSNAIKYGAGAPIEVRLARSGDSAVLTIRDEGIGIAPKDLSRIFDRFERAVPDKNYGGLGLGLYITREIVTALGGKVSAESGQGRGASFRVELSLAGPVGRAGPSASRFCDLSLAS